MRRRDLVTVMTLLSACESSTGAPEGYRSGRIAFQSTQALPAVAPPFVTILDSVDLEVLRANARLLFVGKRVSPLETEATFNLEVPAGPVVFRGRLLTSQGNRVVLSQGTQDAQIDRTGFSVTIPMAAQHPILLVAPDTVRYTVVGTFTHDTLFVHNRGIGQLTWRVSDTNPPLNSPPCRGPCMRIKPDSGVVGPNSVQIVRLDSIQFSAPTFTLTILSPLGQVPVVVRRAP